MFLFYNSLLLMIIIHWAECRSVLFDHNENERVLPKVSSIRTRLTSGNSNTIDNIFQIPIAVIQSTSTAAQSWSPENGETINKVFDIPIQTLQAISNLIKDRKPQYSNNYQNKLIHQSHQNQDHTNRKRFIHNDALSWASTWSDLFFGHHNLTFNPHKLKKKKHIKKKMHHGNHGSHFQHFGHGNQHTINHKPQPILGGNGNIYHVTEDVDDAVLLPSWRPLMTSNRIQNKIAPRFYDQF